MTHENTVFFKERSEWREWLQANYKTSKEVWFTYPMKGAEEQGIIYNDAVEEALCFGWIDSTTGHSDPLHRIQRFTPRRKGSPYSRPNIERLIWLDAQGMLMPEVKESVRELISAPYEFPADIMSTIEADAEAYKSFCGFTEPYKRIRIAYIDAARGRPEEFTKRLNSFLSKTRAGRLIIGFGGIEKYYK